MALIDRLYFHDPHKTDAKMGVYIKMKPAGEVRIDVDIPKDFYDCIMRMAQTAADLHEQKMRAQILADNSVDANPATE